MTKHNLINTQIINLCNDILNYEDVISDYDTRDSYICANIKTYDWINTDDVISVASRLNLSTFLPQILEEFNDNRLSNIYNHVCEWEITSFKEYFINGDCFHGQHYIKNDILPKALNRIDTGYPSLDIKLNKLRSVNSIIKTVLKFFSDDFKALEYLSNFDSSDVFQFGRSGGWLSLAPKDYLYFEDSIGEAQQLIDVFNHNSNQEFNEYIFDEYGSKNALIKYLKNELQNIKDKIKALDWLLERIKNNIKNFKTILLDELEYEINEFISTENFIENTSVILSEEQNNWINGKANQVSSLITLVRRNNNQMETSKNVSIPIILVAEALNSIEIKEQSFNGLKVGNYYIEKMIKRDNDYLIKAGCHIMLLSNIKSVINANL